MNILNKIRIWWGWFTYKHIWILLALFFLALVGFFAFALHAPSENAKAFVPLLEATERSIAVKTSLALTGIAIISALMFIKNYRVHIEKLKEFKKRNPIDAGMADMLIYQAKVTHQTKKAMQWMRESERLTIAVKELKTKEEKIERLIKEVKILEKELGL